MIRFFFTCLLFLPLPVLYGQRAIPVDTATYEGIRRLTGREKVDKLNALVLELQRNNPVLAVRYAEEALSLAEDLDYPLGVVQASLALGSAETDNGQTDVAIDNLSRALQLCNAHGFVQLKADAYRIMGNIFLQERDLASAEVNYFQALAVAREAGDSVTVAKALNNLGMIQSERKNLPEAIRYFIAASDVMRISGNNQLAGTMYNNIGTSYTQVGDYRKADLFLDRAEKVYESYQDERGKAYVWQSRAENHFAQKQYAEADAYMARALTAFETLGLPADIGDALIVYANLQSESKQVAEAQANIQKAIDLAIITSDNALAARACLEMAQLMNVTQATGKAEEYFKKASGYAETVEAMEYAMQANQAYADFLIQQKRPAEATRYLDKCMVLLETKRIPWREWYQVYDIAYKTYSRLQNTEKATTAKKKYDEYLTQIGKKP